MYVPIMPLQDNWQQNAISPTDEVKRTNSDCELQNSFEPPVLVCEPHHLKTETFSEPLIPVHGLSESVQEYIRTVAESYGCPMNYVVTCCLVTAGIAAGKKAVLDNNPYTNYPCDYFCMVGKPSQNKTGPLKEVTRPLLEHDKASFAEYSEKKAVHDPNVKGATPCCEQPVFHQRVTVDSTPESRNELLSHGDMIITIADELKSFMDSFGRYTKGTNGLPMEVSQLNSIWSNVSITINRKSEEATFIEVPAMSIIGGIQPSLIGKTFGAESLMASGFTQRFLFVLPGKVKFTKRRDRKPMTAEMRDSWKSRIDGLFSMEPSVLTLSEEAENIYNDYADDNDIKADAGTDEYISGLIKKMNIHVLRLAVMIHFLSDRWNEPVVDGGTMMYAICVADYYLRIHTECIYPLLTGDRPVQTMTRGELIRTLYRNFDIKSQNALAETLGVSQQYVSKTLKGQ